MKTKYSVDFFWSDEDEAYIAVVPDLPGCSAFGETMADAATEVEQAIAAWIEAALAAGNPVPEPTTRQQFQDCSGKVLLRMPKELHYDLQLAAKQQGTSLNSYICFVLGKRHYHAHAIREFTNSLQWHAVAYRSGPNSQHVMQLASVTAPAEHFTASTLDKGAEPAIIMPLARFGSVHA